MNRSTLFAALLALAAPVLAQSPEKGSWRPANKIAKSITGNLTLAPEKLTVDFVGAFPISQIRALTPAELTAAFDLEPNTPGDGHLYRVNVPATQKFLGKNTLCGGDQTTWMVTYIRGRSLHLAFFSGAAPPLFTPEAFANPTNLCGIYAYGR